jgi:hypothetical protein
MNLTDFCIDLDKRLEAAGDEKERLEISVKGLVQAFTVTPEEVAIFSFDRTMEILYFLWPLRLRNAGNLPLSVHNSLVTRTVRENQSIVDNSFSTTPHASIFEQFRLGPESSPLPIQKIMSVPLCENGAVKGVIQVCRKGADSASSGEAFSSIQLTALTKIAEVVSRHI